MKYMLLITAEEGAALGPDEAAETERLMSLWLEDTIGRGVNLHGGRLRPVSTATSVRVRDGNVLVTDGPFAETKEQIGGYDVIECADLDEAIDVASRHPVARFGCIEVRPFVDDLQAVARQGGAAPG
ncbi:MAG: YciI family protein [Candidatus Dormiibacterota bacterium]